MGFVIVSSLKWLFLSVFVLGGESHGVHAGLELAVDQGIALSFSPLASITSMSHHTWP